MSSSLGNQEDVATNNSNEVESTSSCQSNPKRVCWSFTRQGQCRYGDKCLYNHSEVSILTPDKREQVEDENESPKTHPSICRYFKSSGKCLAGENCRFSHTGVPIIIEKKTKKEAANEDDTKSAEKLPSKRPPLCRYFKRKSSCRDGENCRFRHAGHWALQVHNPTRKTVSPVQEPDETSIDQTSDSWLPTSQKSSSELNNVEDETNGKINQIVIRTQDVRKVVANPLIRKRSLSEITEDDLNSLCQSEIVQLKKRYPQYSEVADKTFQINFVASDPDWPFDVNTLELVISFPNAYPKDICAITCSDKMNGLPLILFRHLNRTFQSWLTEKHEMNAISGTCELLLRPFLHWLDRNLQDIFITGLRMAKKDMDAESQGIVFIPHEDITDDIKDLMNESTHEEDQPLIKESVPSSTTNNTISDFDNLRLSGDINRIEPKSEIASSTKKIGTEIKICNLELMENAATLSCQKLSVLLQCGRCKLRSDITVTPHRTNRVICAKCRHEQKITFRPQLLHQFLAVLGYLDLSECHVVDIPLPKCQFAVGCLNCNRQMTIEGLQFGQRRTTWCLFCNQKMLISMHNVKFNRLQIGVQGGQRDGSGQAIQLGKMKKKVNDPAIHEGSPLPDNGACKHYKKSFRWLRFPCCGKAYPCDVCHEEKESDHEIKIAARMICGYCAKEQPYSNKECILCENNLTKRAGAHWQGGKGCRDNVKMNRLDRQKYSGVNKTVSSRSQRQK